MNNKIQKIVSTFSSNEQLLLKSIILKGKGGFNEYPLDGENMVKVRMYVYTTKDASKSYRLRGMNISLMFNSMFQKFRKSKLEHVKLQVSCCDEWLGGEGNGDVLVFTTDIYNEFEEWAQQNMQFC